MTWGQMTENDFMSGSSMCNSRSHRKKQQAIRLRSSIHAASQLPAGKCDPYKFAFVFFIPLILY